MTTYALRCSDGDIKPELTGLTKEAAEQTLPWVDQITHCGPHVVVEEKILKEDKDAD